ncbi:hypothetical protein [Lachnoclostridium sp. Marseille-P6806]|uniref:hypothetical protein n=1 Tax=Lachnoclostridium sp. Marseille-P6806 TaxID=2364793 RepID=UPI0010301F39|nr:hypothetical protein [Lachnoclostridium sp. Marseille-P6806]
MKNHADAMIFHTAICAEAQIASRRSRKTACADLSASEKCCQVEGWHEPQSGSTACAPAQGDCGACLAQSASAW